MKPQTCSRLCVTWQSGKRLCSECVLTKNRRKVNVKAAQSMLQTCTTVVELRCVIVILSWFLITFILFFPFSSSAVFCVQLLTRLEILVFSTVSRLAFETHTASYPVDCGHFVHMGKQLGCEADLSFPPNADVKNMWNYTSPPPVSS